MQKTMHANLHTGYATQW